MTVLISGGGIVGLTLGLSLHQLGIPFKIFEAVKKPAPLGVGINLQPHAARELFDLGLEDELDQIALRTEEVAYLDSFGSEIWAEPRGEKAGYAWPQYSIHRGYLQMMLYACLIERAGEDCIQAGAAVTDWHETADGVEITLSDRKTGKKLGTETGTIFVAADGINSAARAKLYPDEGPAIWGGTMMWRGVTKGPSFRGGRSMVMAGEKSRKFVTYPLLDLEEGTSLINWIADLTLPPDTLWNRQDWDREGWTKDFAYAFDDWSFDGLDVPWIIQNAEKIWEYPMVDRDPLPAWTNGRMTLTGDAAHAMYPIGSNGASQGIIDARVLARELAIHGLTNAAIMAYEQERREKVNEVLLTNRRDGPDKILDIVANRAPDGFDNIEKVMPLAEREAHAAKYKTIAGMDVVTLNSQPPVITPDLYNK